MIEQDPQEGTSFFYSLNLWKSINIEQYNMISNSRKLAYNFTYLILHACFNQRHLTLPEQTPKLVQALLLAFSRGGEDVSLPFKERKKSRYHKDYKLSELEDENEMEKIDSNVLWAILAYVARDDKCANDFCE